MVKAKPSQMKEKRRKTHKHSWIMGGFAGGIWPWCDVGNHWWKKGTNLTGDKSRL